MVVGYVVVNVMLRVVYLFGSKVFGRCKVHSTLKKA